jgi:Amt family ammonium transporter
LEGAYALQHAEITPWWQLAGVVVVMLIAGVPCLLMCLGFERFGKGLRVTEAQEIAGMDATFWDIRNDEDEVLVGDYVPARAGDAAYARPPVVAGD